MKQFHRFLRLIETTRAMPQTGYVISGIKKSDLSDLAQHHYLVTMIGWYLAKLIKQNRGKINPERVLELCLIHDLGELLGGDIAMPYAKDNPKARKLAKLFERENQHYLERFLTEIDGISPLFKDALDVHSNEAIVAKVADYIEVTEYKKYINRLTDGDVTMAVKKMLQMVDKITHRATKGFLNKFINDWSIAISNDSEDELFEKVKKD